MSLHGHWEKFRGFFPLDDKGSAEPRSHLDGCSWISHAFVSPRPWGDMESGTQNSFQRQATLATPALFPCPRRAGKGPLPAGRQPGVSGPCLMLSDKGRL